MKQIFRSPLRMARIMVFLLVVLSNISFVPAQSEEDAVIAAIGIGGMGRYELGKWSVVGVNAANSSAEEADVTLSVYLESNSRMQFTRRLWVPAGAIRKTWLPIRTPADIPQGQAALHASTLHVVGSGSNAVLRRTAGEPLIHESLLPLDPIEPHMGMIAATVAPGQPNAMSQRDDEAYEALVEVRHLQSDNRIIVGLGGRYLPPYPEAYDALDQLAICSNRFTTDSGGIAAIRAWIARGGRAWIMLDLVGGSGAAWKCIPV